MLTEFYLMGGGKMIDFNADILSGRALGNVFLGIISVST